MGGGGRGRDRGGVRVRGALGGRYFHRVKGPSYPYGGGEGGGGLGGIRALMGGIIKKQSLTSIHFP